MPQISWAGECHLRLSFSRGSTAPLRDLVSNALRAIESASLPGLVDVTPAASTLLLEFNIDSFDEQTIVACLQQAFCVTSLPRPAPPPATIEIPICYELPCAPDAAVVAHIHGITHDELVRLHAEAQYSVDFIGFAPGFGYLSGLPARLNTPRLDSPRTRIPPGSVGIAGDQTCVYPGNTAGGWRLIGRMPLRVFDAGRVKPSLLARGDRVRFVPISLAEFQARGAGRP